MVLVKRKPIVYHSLPSLADVLQPIQQVSTNDASTSSPHPSEHRADHKTEKTENESYGVAVPPDSKDDETQFQQLSSVFQGGFAGARGMVGPGKGKKAGTRVLQTTAIDGIKPNGTSTHDGEPEHTAEEPVSWRIWDRETFYIPETGEMFIDYESFLARMTFYSQPIFQCEVSGKSSLNYFAAQSSEQREARQLHSRFPRPLKKAVLMAVQWQIEGKLEVLADKIFERYVNRFFDDECVFVDVEGDKYLARIVKTFPPRSLAASTSASPISKFPVPPPYHPYAADLALPLEEVNEKDDPMGYFYNVQLIEENSALATATHFTNGHANGDLQEEEEKWEGSTMEVQADKISRDRINFSRAMLKRFIRDCVVRDPAVYSPWLVKPSVAERYGVETEMPESVRESIQRFRDIQMDKRKRDRDERLGITHDDKSSEVETVEDKPKTKKQKKEEERRLREEEKEREKEEAAKKKKPLKYPAEDLLVEYSAERDEPHGRLEIRPTPNREMPFHDKFEKFLMSWSFLNAMGKPLGLSPFTLDDYEYALYHNEPRSSPTPIMIEIHATLLNALINDFALGNEPVKPLVLAGAAEDNDTDYWEGKGGATAELLRPVASGLADNWKVKELRASSGPDNRKGWEGALVGCLWERATLSTLPNYLDNILHLTFEDKPAPTRPTWSTGPASAASGHGLIPSRPDKRYSTLHHVHKLEIICFLSELAAQTAKLRDFMEQSTAELTEVRKDIVEVKREQRQLRAEREALEPKPEPEAAEDGAEAGEANGDANGDVSMEDREAVKEERSTPEPSIDGLANGHAYDGTEQDELDSTPDSMDASDPLSDPEDQENGPNVAAAARRKAMKERAAEREAEEAGRAARAAEERTKAKETKHVAAEKRRLQEEIDALSVRLKGLDHDFRSHMYTLRARPFGIDRFGNKVWWMDGCGSAPLVGENGKILWGTGRLYVQGGDGLDLEFAKLAAEMSDEEVEMRRAKEEGEGRLAVGEWGAYDTVDSLQAFMKWLNPRGVRENALLKAINPWLPELEGGIRRRRITSGQDAPPESEEPVKRARPVRKVAGGGAGDAEGVGYQGWQNRRA